MRCNNGGIVLATVLLLATPAVTARGATAVGVDLQVDGQTVAGTIFTGSGESEAEIWQSLKRRPLRFERGFSVPPSAEDESKATLTGEIVVQVKQAGEAGASATVEQLELEHRDGNWYVTDAEVMRTMAAAGLQAPVEPAEGPAGQSRPVMLFGALPIFLLLIVGLLIAFVVIVILSLTLRKKQPQ